MLTINNYKEKTAKVNFAKQPDYIKDAHKDFADYAEFYDEDKDIQEMLDNHMKLVNDIIKREYANQQKQLKCSKSVPNRSKTSQTVPKHSKTLKTTVAKKATPTKKIKKCNKEEIPKCKVEPIKTEHYTEDVRLIRRFAGCIGKERQRRTILTIYRDFERRITERKVSRISKHAGLVVQCSKKMAALLDAMTKQKLTHATMELDDKFSKEVTAASKELAIRTSVNLLKRFVGIEGEIKPDRDKVKRIADAFTNANLKGKLEKGDFYEKEIYAAHFAMKNYLEGKTDIVAIEPTALSGLDNVFCVGKPKATAKKKPKKSLGSGEPSKKKSVKKKAKRTQLNGVEDKSTPEKLKEQVMEPKGFEPSVQEEPIVVSRFSVELKPEVPARVDGVEDNEEVKSELFTPITAEVADNGQSKIELPTDLGKFLGYVERYEYSILLRGEKGAGKSRMTYQMMNVFAKAGFTVGCFSLEIGKQSNIVKDMRDTYISPTIADKVQIADAAPNGLDDIRAAAKIFDVVCIDSWGKIPNIKSTDFDDLRKEFPKTMFIIIFQSTTNGTARGGSGPEYDAGIVIQVQAGGKAICEKNRYSGEDLTYLVFERKLLDTNTQKVS
ncbi:hypothetical protein [Saccharicrinis aurantiacus]|uniref:hypothetical protein n=1 Tax=Saccharicrinis aurantiacus TaxID=1849719 RepID=UPI0009501ED1|nr:hypothetical protein [Saccharicrinis aurantiacus]